MSETYVVTDSEANSRLTNSCLIKFKRKVQSRQTVMVAAEFLGTAALVFFGCMAAVDWIGMPGLWFLRNIFAYQSSKKLINNLLTTAVSCRKGDTLAISESNWISSVIYFEVGGFYFLIGMIEHKESAARWWEKLEWIW